MNGQGDNHWSSASQGAISSPCVLPGDVGCVQGAAALHCRMLWKVHPSLGGFARFAGGFSPAPSLETAGMGLKLSDSCFSSIQALLFFHQKGHRGGQLSSFWEPPVGLLPSWLWPGACRSCYVSLLFLRLFPLSFIPSSYLQIPAWLLLLHFLVRRDSRVTGLQFKNEFLELCGA